jgi:hypothetical protein
MLLVREDGGPNGQSALVPKEDPVKCWWLALDIDSLASVTMAAHYIPKIPLPYRGILVFKADCT